MKNQNKVNEPSIILQLLRKKQEKFGIKYIKTTDLPYKIFNILAVISFIVATALNFLFVISKTGYLNTLKAYAGELSDFQASQLSAIEGSITSVIILSIIFILGLVFLLLKKPILELIFTLLPAIMLISVYYSAMSQGIDSGDFAPFVFRHLLPILFTLLFVLVCSIINLRQNYLDNTGCEAISEALYTKYSVDANNLTEEQWQEFLSSLTPADTLNKKQRKRLEKKLNKNNQTEV